MTETELRNKIVAQAKSWVGCKESDNSHMKIIDVYNAHSPLARSYTVKNTDSWCATFVSACAIAVGLTDVLPTECSCGKQIELFQGLNRWQELDSYTPKAGDVIYYDWGDDGSGDCTGWPEHVGLVTAVVGTAITVIEGNKSNAVGYRTMAVNGKYIRGYGVPDYDSLAGTGLANALEHLTQLGVISSPDYWTAAVAAGKLDWLTELICQASDAITKCGTRSATVEAGVAALVTAGVVSSPDYWLSHYDDVEWLEELICALGGSV